MNHCSIFNSFGFSLIKPIRRLTYSHLFMAICICSVVFMWKQIEIGENQKTEMMDQGKVQFLEEIFSLANQLPNFMDSQMKTLNIHAMSAETISTLRPAQIFVHKRVNRILTTMCAAMLAACGGGSGGSDAASDAMSLAKTVTAFVPKPANPPTSAPVSPASPSDTNGTTAPVVVGATVTDFRLQNLGNAQTNVPFTFGQVIAAGTMAASEGLAAKLPDGTLLRLQSDIKATHADGTVRHVIISGIMPSLAAGATQTLKLVKSNVSERSTESVQSLANSGLGSKVTIKVEGVQYSASLVDAFADPAPTRWLSGKVANEWLLTTPLKNAAGVAHPWLTARFDVRWYSSLPKQARVDVVVENDKTFKAARTLTYDVDVEVGGRSIYSKIGLMHYHHARWHKSGWWDVKREPAVHVQHNGAYLMATKAVSNYDRTIVPAEDTLALLDKQIRESETGPMTIGPVVSYMGTAGGRGDIGPLPMWSAMYLLSADKRARDAMMAAADGSGTWSIHYRDENTGQPVRTDNEANKDISTHLNMSQNGPLPVPRCANNDGALCITHHEADTAHQPSLAYLPYLLTGDYFYLEELQFWASSNPLGTSSGNHGRGQGLVRWQQLRGQAWSLRTLGHSAYITPDAHPLKGYFNKQVENNLDFYHETYVVGNPNKLGVYDGSGSNAFAVNGSAAWQDDFLTWSFGYLAELGFPKATPILNWKAKYPVGRMTAPGYCWIQGGPYWLNFRDAPNTPIYDSFEALYKANFGGPSLSNDDGEQFTHPNGIKFIDLPCGSQAQADYLTLANGYPWPVGFMTGYSGTAQGYPSNMQPALAVAATSSTPNARQAWATFAARASKPDYTRAPQWAIVPR